MKTKMVYIVAALMLVLSMAVALIPAGTAKAEIFDIADGDVDGVDGLIAAINASNVNSEPDTINLAAGGTYTLNTPDSDTDGPNGLPSINSSITINGNGATIQRSTAGGTPNFRIFHVSATGNVSISGMTIRNGNTIFNGGGIYSFGELRMISCTVSGNYADDDGGGIYNSSGNVTLTNCTISGNTAGASVNHYGGGIYNSGNVTLTNCTVTNNAAKGDTPSGGGIYSSSNLTLKCTIVYGNTAGGSGDIDGNKVATECIIGDPDGDPDPLLGPLQDNGGPTETHALMTGSPAIDACTDCTVNTDQRGLPRPVGGNYDGIPYCDVGAYEKQLAVGGIVEPVDRLELLAPWLALAALMAVATAVVVIMRRRRLS